MNEEGEEREGEEGGVDRGCVRVVFRSWFIVLGVDGVMEGDFVLVCWSYFEYWYLVDGFKMGIWVFDWIESFSVVVSF